MRILLADTDQTLCSKLEKEGFVVEGSTDMLETVAYITTLHFDAALIVCPLTDAVPARLVSDLRRDGVSTPIIVQGRFDAVETIKLLAIGADDVVSHDILSDEVVARIRAVIRRSAGRAASVITAGPITLDINSHLAKANGIPLHLTGKEYAILELMILRRGVTLTKEVILSQLYNDRDEPEVKIIDVFVCKLRKKLRRAGVEDFVQTVWGRGFLVGESAVSGASMAPELRDMVDSPPTYVTHRTTAERDAMRLKHLAKVESPPLVPAA